jgi:hypothetical protein
MSHELYGWRSPQTKEMKGVGLRGRETIFTSGAENQYGSSTLLCPPTMQDPPFGIIFNAMVVQMNQIEIPWLFRFQLGL